MVDRLTDPAQRVLRVAAGEARALGHRHVGPEHVLLAVCSEPQTTARALRAAGVNADEVRAAIEQALRIGRAVPRDVPVPWALRTQRVLARTLGLIPADAPAAPGTDAILLALAMEEEGISAQILNRLDLSLVALRDVALSAITAWDPGISGRVAAEDARWRAIRTARGLVGSDPFATTAPDLVDGLIEPDRVVLAALGSRVITSRRLVGGDPLLYARLVRMTRDWVTRYPLATGHGNFGSRDGYPEADMSYTEARLSAFAQDADRVPLILLNGGSGIPPHNLGEVIDTVLAYLDDPTITAATLVDLLRGPDFPTGGTVTDPGSLAAIYAVGHGEIVLRGRMLIESTPLGHRLVIVELPYGIDKGGHDGVCQEIVDGVHSHVLTGITELCDESGRAGMRIHIDLAPGVDPEASCAQLYAHTQLQTTIPVELTASVNGATVRVDLREMIGQWVMKRREKVEETTLRAELRDVRARHADARRTTLG